MENVLVREEIVLTGVEAEITLLDFIGECESIGCEMFVEQKGNEESFATINDLFEFWAWLGIDDLEEAELDFISISYIEGYNEVEVKLKVNRDVKEFVIGVL